MTLDEISQRLDRIETKLDELLRWAPRSNAEWYAEQTESAQKESVLPLDFKKR